MELFIRADDIYMEIHKVTLKDGHIPMIGDQLPAFLSENEFGYCNPHQIEPAVWFKVMVVDSISIDCTKRTIMWNSDSSLPYVEAEDILPEGKGKDGASKRRRRVSESMYIGGELYGFESDLDELFDTLQLAVVNFASSETSREDFNSEVMRMLHCYVLPLIKLTTEDVPKMREVYAKEEYYIQLVDKSIMQKDKQMMEVSKAMQRQRNAFLSDFVSFADGFSTLTDSARACSLELAEVLIDDFEGDLQALHQKLDEVQREVEEAKRAVSQEGILVRDSLSLTSKDSLEGSLSSEDDISSDQTLESQSKSSRLLQEKRMDRNDCHKKLKNLLCVRENLRVFLSESEELAQKEKKRSFMKSLKKPPQPEKVVIHSVYMGMREKLQELRNETKVLVDKKVLIISVKEALRTTLEELEVSEESLGFDVGVMQGSRPTDVLHRSIKPREWLTLGERVADLIGHPSNQVCILHNNFCATVINRCRAAMFEKHFIDVSHNAQRTGSLEGENKAGENSSDSDAGIYVENKLFSVGSDQSSDNSQTDSSDRSASLSLHIQKTSPVNSILSETSDLDTGSESRNSSSSASQSDFSILQPDPEFCPSDGGCESLVQMEGQLGDEDIVIVHSNGRDPLRRAIEDLKQNTQHHFEQVCEMIQTSLENKAQTVAKKVWLSYEHHFYDSTLESLTQLYNYTFRPVTTRLERLVPYLTVEDLDLDDTIIANMLEEKRPVLSKEIMPTMHGDLVESDSETESLNLSVSSSEPASPVIDPVTTASDGTGFIKGSPRVRLLTHPAEKNTPQREINRKHLSSPGSGNLQRIKIHYPMSVTVVCNRSNAWSAKDEALLGPEHTELGMDALSVSTEQKAQHTPQQLQHSSSTASSFSHLLRRNLFPNRLQQKQKRQALPSVLEDSDLSVDNEDSTDGVSPIVGRDIKLKAEFYEQFKTARECLSSVRDGSTPLAKLQSLMRCLREVTTVLSDYQARHSGQQVSSGSGSGGGGGGGGGACSDDIIDMLIVLLLNCDVTLTAGLYPHLMFLTDTLPPFFEGGPYQFCLVQFSVAYQFLQDRLLLKNRRDNVQPQYLV